MNVPLIPGRIPSKKDIDKVLSILGNAENGPVYIHCKQSVDRTGLLTAIYRVRHQQWSYENAYNEMMKDGFHNFPLFYWVGRLKEYSKQS